MVVVFPKAYKELRDPDGKPIPYFQEDNVINESLNGGSSLDCVCVCKEFLKTCPIDIMIWSNLHPPERGEVFLNRDEFERWHEDMYIAYLP